MRASENCSGAHLQWVTGMFELPRYAFCTLKCCQVKKKGCRTKGEECGGEVPIPSCTVSLSKNERQKHCCQSYFRSRTTFFKKHSNNLSGWKINGKRNWPIPSILMLPNSGDSSLRLSYYECVRRNIAMVKDCINEGVEGRRGNCAKQQKARFNKIICYL